MYVFVCWGAAVGRCGEDSEATNAPLLFLCAFVLFCCLFVFNKVRRRLAGLIYDPLTSPVAQITGSL